MIKDFILSSQSLLRPKTIILIPSTTMRENMFLSKVHITGKYFVPFHHIQNSPVWWSEDNVNPEMLYSILEKKLLQPVMICSVQNKPVN